MLCVGCAAFQQSGTRGQAGFGTGAGVMRNRHGGGRRFLRRSMLQISRVKARVLRAARWRALAVLAGAALGGLLALQRTPDGGASAARGGGSVASSLRPGATE